VKETVPAGPNQTPPTDRRIDGQTTAGAAAGTEGDPGSLSPTDEALMSAYAEGDAEAFDMLYSRHKGVLYRYFTRQLTESDAHDCFQTLWLKVIDHRDRYRPSAPFRHYLFALAHNVLMDQHRQSMRRKEAPFDDQDTFPGPAANPEGTLARRELREALHTLVRALPAHQREVWLLRQETDLSTADIARATGATEEGVKSRLRYARDKLKQGMARYAEKN
jgi:RNA polymerase sigma-70 factor (ECF subfamily)